MFHDVLHRLEATNRQKIFEPLFSKFSHGPNFEKYLENTQYHSQNMFHDVLHPLQTKKSTKYFRPNFQKILQVIVP